MWKNINEETPEGWCLVFDEITQEIQIGHIMEPVHRCNFRYADYGDDDHPYMRVIWWMPFPPTPYEKQGCCGCKHLELINGRIVFAKCHLSGFIFPTIGGIKPEELCCKRKEPKEENVYVQR